MKVIETGLCHNPYFNRWFSAIGIILPLLILKYVTILILIDGFLQYSQASLENISESKVTILILIDGFLQCFAELDN